MMIDRDTSASDALNGIEGIGIYMDINQVVLKIDPILPSSFFAIKIFI